MTITTLKKWLRRVIRLILLICLIAILQNSSTGSTFSKPPHVTAKWEIDSPDNNHLGDVIKATLRVTTPPGMRVDTEKLPGKGDVLPLPPGVNSRSSSYPPYDAPPGIPEGELEVISSQITQYSEGGLIITEIDYELQYLLPIDLSAPVDDKRLPWDVPIFQSHRRLFVSTGKIGWLTTKIYVEMANFYIVPRVDENSQPIFALFKLTPRQAGPYVRLAGWGLISLALGLLAWRVAIVKARRRQNRVADEAPDANEMYQIWCQNPDQAIFIEALKLYRAGIWGRPQASTWITTTFILYSGISLNLEQTKTVFARLIKEVTNEPSP